MARPSKSRRNMMGDRIREAAQHAAGAERGEVGTDEGRAYFEKLDELGVASGDPSKDVAGEVLGAGTGRAKRAIQADALDEIQWDPTRPYPQIQTGSSNPERPRTVAAGYDPSNAILRITFREGATYEYLGPSPRQWSAFQRAASPGKYITQVLEQYPYRPLAE